MFVYWSARRRSRRQKVQRCDHPHSKSLLAIPIEPGSYNSHDPVELHRMNFHTQGIDLSFYHVLIIINLLIIILLSTGLTAYFLCNLWIWILLIFSDGSLKVSTERYTSSFFSHEWDWLTVRSLWWFCTSSLFLNSGLPNLVVVVHCGLRRLL